MKGETTKLSPIPRRLPDSPGPNGARTNLRAQGLRTRKLIVQAATKLLLKSGGLDFTLRAVARQAKVSVSNLQYYFPDRQELLRAVMAPVIDAYLAELGRALHGDIPPREALHELLKRQMQDAKDADTRILWWHFAALSSTDPECSRLFEEWYDTLVRGVGKLVAKINPDFGTSGSIQFASLIIGMGDGLSFLMHAGRKHSYTRDLDAAFLATIDVLLRRGPVSALGKAA